jgi:hypothetical protein
VDCQASAFPFRGGCGSEVSPYIVTTKKPAVQTHVEGMTETHGHRLDRRAVATLDEAKDAVIDAAPEDSIGKPAEVALLAAEIAHLPEQGGTVSLPDGTVSEVEHASWDDLVGPNGWNAHSTVDDVVAAFNEAQGGPR